MANLLDNPTVRKAYTDGCSLAGLRKDGADLFSQGKSITTQAFEEGILDFKAYEKASSDGPLAFLSKVAESGSVALRILHDVQQGSDEVSDVKKVVGFILNGLVQNDAGLPQFQFTQVGPAENHTQTRVIPLRDAVEQHPVSVARGEGFTNKTVTVLGGMIAVSEVVEIVTSDETRVMHRNPVGEEKLVIKDES